MQIAVVTSNDTEISSAIAQAQAKNREPKLLILLTSYEQLKEATKELSVAFPNTPCIGTSTISYHTSQSSDKECIIISFGQDATCEAGILRHLSTCPLYDIAEMEDKIQKVRAGDENSVCIEFCTNDEERLVTTLNVALEHSHIPLIGGTVFGYPAGATPFVMMDGVLYEDACCYAIIRYNSGKIRTYSETIYGPMANGRSHIATEVNLSNKELLKLDGRPAAEVYCEETGVSKGEIVDNVLTNPLGRVLGNEIFISSPYAVSGSGCFTNYKRINTNDTIEVLQLLDYKSINAQTRDDIRHGSSHISFIFSVNCIYRHLLFEKEHYLTEYLSGMSSVGEHIGIVGGGEQYKKQHVNQTMVCAVFE